MKSERGPIIQAEASAGGKDVAHGEGGKRLRRTLEAAITNDIYRGRLFRRSELQERSPASNAYRRRRPRSLRSREIETVSPNREPHRNRRSQLAATERKISPHYQKKERRAERQYREEAQSIKREMVINKIGDLKPPSRRRKELKKRAPKRKEERGSMDLRRGSHRRLQIPSHRNPGDTGPLIE